MNYNKNKKIYKREASEFLGSEDQRVKLQKEIRNKKVCNTQT